MPTHASHLMWMPGQARGQSSCSSLGRFGGPCYLLDNLPPSVSPAAAPCASPSPGSHWHMLGAGGWPIAAASAVPCLTARGMQTGIPKAQHRHPDKLGREVTPRGSQQSQASHAAPDSPAREHCSCYPFTPAQFIHSSIAIFYYYSDYCEYKGLSSSGDTPSCSLEDLYIRLQRFNSGST